MDPHFVLSQTKQDLVSNKSKIRSCSQSEGEFKVDFSLGTEAAEEQKTYNRKQNVFSKVRSGNKYILIYLYYHTLLFMMLHAVKRMKSESSDHTGCVNLAVKRV